MAILAWIKSRKIFLKIQEGTGDNLSSEDLKKGFVDYISWATFQTDDLDIDDMLDMNLVDGGMLMFKSKISAREALPDCYSNVFGNPYKKSDVVILLQNDD